jgi:hypothetical protein
VKGFKSAKAAVGRIWERIRKLGEPEKPKADKPEPKAKRKAKGGAQAAKGAPVKGKAAKKATAAKKAPKAKKAAKAQETAGPREGSKTGDFGILNWLTSEVCCGPPPQRTGTLGRA